MESEKMKEIKKALECCIKNEIEKTCEYCGNCPAGNWDYETECNVELFQKTLTLINHQDFQISTLKVQVANLEKELKKEQKTTFIIVKIHNSRKEELPSWKRKMKNSNKVILSRLMTS